MPSVDSSASNEGSRRFHNGEATRATEQHGLLNLPVGYDLCSSIYLPLTIGAHLVGLVFVSIV